MSKKLRRLAKSGIWNTLWFRKFIMKANSFAVCINNKGYEASLEFGKIYQVIVDKDAEAEGLIRIIDESGEDYGYSLERFHAVALPQTLDIFPK